MKSTFIISIFILCCSCTAQQKVATNTFDVFTAAGLQQALNNAKAGDEIFIKDGVYKGNFVIPSTANGTAANPIILKGSTKSILDGSTTNTGYVLHLQANYWLLKGFTITNGLKGLMTDNANYNLIDGLTVNAIGEEAIHLRRFSSKNTIQNCIITNAGVKTADYGEGVYIGTAVSNWAKYTNGAEDKSDSNIIINNTIGPNITAECIDVKEGTTGGIIRGNKFNSTGITGANSGDSWMDVKGNGYLIESNTGFNPKGSVLKDGYQVHCAVDGWGCNNIFKNNASEINAEGYGINVTLESKKGKAMGNKVYKSNTVLLALSGLTNISIEP